MTPEDARAVWALRRLARDRRDFDQAAGPRALYLLCDRCPPRADGRPPRPHLGAGIDLAGSLVLLDVPHRERREQNDYRDGPAALVVPRNGLDVRAGSVSFRCPMHATFTGVTAAPGRLVALVASYVERGLPIAARWTFAQVRTQIH